MLSQSLIQHGPSVVTAPEELDTVTAPALSRELTCEAAPDHALIVDFCRTRYCDVAALNEVLQLVAALQMSGSCLTILSRSTVLAELAGALGVAHAWGEAAECSTTR